MIRAYLKDRWWSLAGVTGIVTVAALAQPLYWKTIVAILLALLPLSYVGYVAWPKWRKPVPPHQRLTMLLLGAGITLLLIGECLELVGHGHVIRGLSIATVLVGCALMIVSGLRSSDS